MKTKFFTLIGVMVLVGLGCGNGLLGVQPEGAIGLEQGYYMIPPEGYLTPEDKTNAITDYHCLVYLDDSYKLTGQSWHEETATQRFGDNGYNLVRWRDGGYLMKIDAHLLGTKVKFTLDNPSGKQRCVDEFYEILRSVGGGE